MNQITRSTPRDVYTFLTAIVRAGDTDHDFDTSILTCLHGGNLVRSMTTTTILPDKQGNVSSAEC